MRRLFFLCAVILLLALPVWAAGSVTSAQSETTISSDGSCQVTMTLRLTLDTLPSELVFPLPADARDITVNGSAARSRTSGSFRNVDLSAVVAAPGSHTLVIRYRLEDVITRQADQLLLTLPILCGFDYPIDSVEFTVTLPGAAEARPSFRSTYYQETIETMMTSLVEGNTIRGSILTRLQDHETLTMTLDVTEEMFPQPVTKRWSMDTVDLVMLCIAGAAIAYWLLTMRCLPPRRLHRANAPDGITAGELGCRLTGQGADMTMMVLSWAQMGYILIQPDDSGRVLLHKRMDMGNERSEFENKWFRKLFGRRTVIDGCGHHYAKLCRKTANLHPGARDMYRQHSGNPLFFRALCAAAGAVSGVSLAAAYAPPGGWQTLLAIILAICGFVAAWLIQSAGKAFHSRHRRHLLTALLCALLWILASYGVGEWNIALIQIAAQFLAGLAALYGGRRSDAGKSNAAEILGLRHYLKTISCEELQRILRGNPQYFYDLAPFALALGVDRSFSRRLKDTHLPECPYLTTGMDGHMTAAQWNRLLRRTVQSMDATQHRLPIDRLLGR